MGALGQTRDQTLPPARSPASDTPPQPSLPSSPPAQPPSQSQVSVTPMFTINAFPLTPMEMVGGGLLLLIVLIIAFFLKRAIVSHLIDALARPPAAQRVGWMFLFFVVMTSATAIFSFLGNLWTVLPFIVPMSVVAVISFIVFLILYLGASRR